MKTMKTDTGNETWMGLVKNNVTRAAMLLVMMLICLTAEAQEEIEYYDLWLGDTQVTSANKDNILNETKDGQPTAKFNLSTYDEHILTLNNPTITGTHNNSKIYSGLGELYLEGSYHMSEAETDYGIYADGNVITGEYTFFGNKCGVYCDELIVYSCNIKAVGGDYGVHATQLDFSAYTLDSEGGKQAIDGIVYYYGRTIIALPEGGGIKNHQIYEADGTTIAKHVILNNPKVYNLWLGSTQVNSVNKDNILNQLNDKGEPTASYDPETHTLTLNNPTISDFDTHGSTTSKIYYSDDRIMNLTIKGCYHMADTETDNGIMMDGYGMKFPPLTLDGEFTFIGTTSGIYLPYGDITVKSGSLTAVGMNDIGGAYGILGNSLTVEDGVDYIELQGGIYALHLRDGGGLHLAEGYAITTPENGIFRNNIIYHSDRLTHAKTAVIQNTTSPIQFYDLWVGGIHVSDRNQDDILGDGKASFDPATNTLTLTGNPTIPGITNHSKIYSKLSGLTVTGTYHMTEAEGRSGIYSEGGPLTLNGDFTFLSKGYWISVTESHSRLQAGNTLWATGDITLNGNISAQGQDVKNAAIYTENGSFTVQGGNLQASSNNTCAAYCGGTFTANGTAESITLEGSPGAIHAGNFVIDNAAGQQLGYYEPEYAFFSTTWKSVYSTEGNTDVLATRVVLRQPKTYNLWVGDTQVSESNCDDILGDGKAKFDPATTTLTLDNPTISGHYLSNGFESKIASEGMNLTLKGVYRMEEVDNYAVVGLHVSGGTLTTEGDFTFRGLTDGVEVTDNMSVKGHLHAVGSLHAGINYSGTDADKGLTLVPGFIGETKVELEGSLYANAFSSTPYHIGQSGLTLAEPDGGSIEAITYRINDSSGNRAAHAVLTLKGTANGQGTEQNPYRINSREEWAAACEDVANGVELSGKFVALNNDIKVYQMMGTKLNPFSGTFDGYGHTLTASINQSVQGTAPFHAISGATIKNLKVQGMVIGYSYNSGLVGYVKGDGNLIQNCEVSASIGSSGGYNGGFVGHAGNYTTTLDGCVFRGSFFGIAGSSELNNGTFVGWDETGAQLTLTRCLDLTQSDPIGRGQVEPTAATNIYSTYNKSTITGNNAWTTTPQLAYKVTGSDVNLTLTGTTGTSWNGNLYAAQGETLSFTIDRPYVNFTSTAGTFTQDHEECTLVMPAENVTILNANASSFDIALTPVTNGTVAVKNASRVGAVVGIHITPNTYYLLDEVTVTDANNNDIEVEIDEDYGFFTMPNSDVTVSVTFKKQYSFENGVLHLKYGDFHIINRLAFDSDVLDHPENVTKVIADEGVRFTQSCATLFQGFTGCTEMDLSKVNTAGLVTTSNMFLNCTNLQKLNLSGWETQQIFSMSSMFEGCSSLREIDLSGFHVSDGTNTTKMFDDAGICKLTLPAGMAVTKEMMLNKGYTYHNTYEGTWSNGTWSYSGWTILGANGEVVSTVGDVIDSNNNTHYYAEIPTPPVVMTFVWKDMPDDFTLELPDGQDNSRTIADWNGIKTSVQLTGRKLYKDGDWNTICLPFKALTLEIQGAFGTNDEPEIIRLSTDYYALREENGESTYVCSYAPIRDEDNGFIYCTGFDETTGTLSLFFEPSSYEIMPGEPYLIKWPKDTEHPYIESPTFTGVTIDISSDEANVSKTVTSNDGKVSFVGTYDNRTFTAADKSVLFLGTNNSLYYPQAGTTIGAFRSYFQLNGIEAGTPNGVKEFRLNFGDEDSADGIGDAVRLNDKGQMINDAWYSLDGRKFGGKPTKSGVYIRDGRKVVIK